MCLQKNLHKEAKTYMYLIIIYLAVLSPFFSLFSITNLNLSQDYGSTSRVFDLLISKMHFAILQK